ncbi:ClpXP adapter SpxH family protein [Bacillus sp. JJ722]|uniref:ClpXP adapter SpxH family protein n=1 Tax=Bacillus sp. JJ722 TaxID=3122973 RepID=UPI003F689993
MSTQENTNFIEWLHKYHCNITGKKPIEIYVFIDPLCPQCWGMEPILKKLQMEYGNIISIKHVLSGKLATLNTCTRSSENIATLWEKTASRTGMSCEGELWINNSLPLSMPYNASIAIKAAELQGRKQGIKFLRKFQEYFFLKKKNISEMPILIECAKAVKLDIDEFLNDIHSKAAAKAFQCDVKITNEMDVQEIPSLVFFNSNIEEEGIKVSGCYSYDVYLSILSEMMPNIPEPSPLPNIESFVRFYNVVATKEIAITYDLTDQAVENEMKKLQLQRVVECIPAKYGMFWKYIT